MNTCERLHMYGLCKQQFLSKQNIYCISSHMRLNYDIVAKHAMEWIDESVAYESDYHPVILNEMFVYYLYSRQYNPLSTALQRSPLLPDQNELRISDMGIKKPYQYDQRAPDIFRHKEIISNIVKNNLPGNQAIRYLRKETSIYDEQQELTPFLYKEPLARQLLYQPATTSINRVLQPHFVQPYNEKYLMSRH